MRLSFFRFVTACGVGLGCASLALAQAGSGGTSGGAGSGRCGATGNGSFRRHGGCERRSRREPRGSHRLVVCARRSQHERFAVNCGRHRCDRSEDRCERHDCGWIEFRNSRIRIGEFIQHAELHDHVAE